ncbi:GM23046 [Drosophila sechellia]|uniref:GM23046 n=1 Tax=Drosophila sechellia TaxID=7238 RepID=B4I6A1_DROSE|nr:GM23046 [Drosophila sechellia]
MSENSSAEATPFGNDELTEDPEHPSGLKKIPAKFQPLLEKLEHLKKEMAREEELNGLFNRLFAAILAEVHDI